MYKISNNVFPVEFFSDEWDGILGSFSIMLTFATTKAHAGSTRVQNALLTKADKLSLITVKILGYQRSQSY
jgi:hypothetical protein